MRKVTMAAALAVLGLLPGCKQDGEAPQASLRSQAMVMTTPWLPVSPAETRVSIVGDDPVTERRSRWEPGKRLYAEAMQTANGQLLFERRRRVPAGQALPPDQELLKRYVSSGAVAQAKIALATDNIVRRRLDNGELVYLVGEDKLRCVVFFLYANDSIFAEQDGVEPHYQAFTGSACEKPGSTKAQRLEERVVDLVSRVRFDDGRQSRSKIFAQALKQLREKPLAEDVEVATSGRDTAPPALSVARQVKTDAATARLEGSISDASPLSEVRLDGRWLHVAADGRFQTTRPVPPGSHRMSLVALDQFGNRANAEIVVSRSGGVEDDRPVAQRAGRYHALVIGVKSYRAPIPALVTPPADAHALGRILAEDYGFDVTTLIDATKADIVGAITKLRDRLGEDDNLLVYYAGHGILDPETNLGYWLPSDARADNPDNWISNKHVSRLIRAIPARHVVVVADACYSGAFAREQDLLRSGNRGDAADEVVWLRSRTAFSSGELEEVLDEGGGNNSLFAMHLLNTLRKNSGIVSGRTLSAAVRGLVRKDAAQTPQYGAVTSAGHDEGGDFLFIRRSAGRS